MPRPSESFVKVSWKPSEAAVSEGEVSKIAECYSFVLSAATGANLGWRRQSEHWLGSAVIMTFFAFLCSQISRHSSS